MNTPIDEAYARLTMLEYALEVVFSQNLCVLPEELSRTLKKDFVRIMENGPLLAACPGGATSAQEQKEAEIHKRAVEMGEAFMRKVARREDILRAVIKSMPGATKDQASQ